MSDLERCRLCQGEPWDDIRVDDSIPLCNRHWNTWLIRVFNSDENPPSGAHLIRTPETTESEKS